MTISNVDDSVVANDFPAMDVGSRADRLRDRLSNALVDALLVTHLPNVRYLTGFTGSAGVVFISLDSMTLITDGRYQTQSREQLSQSGAVADIEIVATTKDQMALVAGLAATLDRIGLEENSITWAQQQMWANAMGDRQLVPTSNLIESLRLVKEPGEVARIRAACAIADSALQGILPILGTGVSEREFALTLEVAMRKGGAAGTSFDSIVAAGPNGAMPHARPSDRIIGSNELVVIDFGCIVDGYCSDMTRTLSVDDPGPEATRLWNVVQQSQAAGRDAVRAGVSCREVDRACRDIIDNAGWAEAFSHGTGHGVGLEIHEAPRVAYSSEEVLESGYIVTVEPGVYLPGVGGVRLEDTVVVTDNGCEALTEFPKYLYVS